MVREIIDATPNVAILTTFKSGGHDCFSAIEDIIDNSIESYVNSKNINVNLEATENGIDINKISIVDDGIGMDKNTLKQAIKLASSTNKLPDMYGFYGVGLKASAATIGNILKIYTKQENTPLYSLTMNRNEMIEKNSFEIELYEDREEDWDVFMKYGNFKSGTIILIEDLYNGKLNGQKRISSIYPKLFVQLGIVYNKIIVERKDLNFKLNGVDIFPINPILSDIEELKCVQVNKGDDKFVYNGDEFIAKVYDVSAETSSNKILVRQTFEHAIKGFYNYSNYQNTPYFDKVIDEIYSQTKLSIRNSGLFTYRNNRLTGFGLDMGIVEKGGDGYRNRLRIELFYNGNSDYLFCSSFNKIVSDRKSALNDEFKEVLLDNIVQYRNQVVAEARKRSAAEKEREMDKKEEAEKLRQNIEEITNNPLSLFVGVLNETNNDIDLTPKENKEANKDKKVKKAFNLNKDLIKNAKNKYSINVEYQELGENNIICDYKQNGLNIDFSLNLDTPFIKEMYMSANEDSRFYMNQLLFAFCSSARIISENYEYPDSVYMALMEKMTKCSNALVLK